MFSFIAQVQPLKSLFNAITTSPVSQRNLASDLFEAADTRAGYDPRHAAELRESAQAYLRVVR